MKLVARIRHLSLVMAALGALVAPVLAGEHVAPGGTDDTQVRSRSLPASSESAPSTAPASRTPRTSVNPTDDVYAPRPAKSSSAPSARPAELAPAPAAPPAPANAPPARKRESASTLNRPARPATPRAKISMRNLPAAPGMGTLLRVGVSAGREISMLEYTVPSAPRTAHSGRAPPRGDAIAHLAPAALPGAPPSAANIARAHLSAAPLRSTHPDHTTTEPGPLGPDARELRACANRPAAHSVSRFQAPAGRTGPGARRSESTPAPRSPRLSGGLAT
jgi:hypothetical protein